MLWKSVHTLTALLSSNSMELTGCGDLRQYFPSGVGKPSSHWHRWQITQWQPPGRQYQVSARDVSALPPKPEPENLPLGHITSHPPSTNDTLELQAAKFKGFSELPVADMSLPAITIEAGLPDLNSIEVEIMQSVPKAEPTIQPVSFPSHSMPVAFDKRKAQTGFDNRLHD